MAKFRQGNVVLTSSQDLKKDGDTLTLNPTLDSDHSANGDIVPMTVDSTANSVFASALYANSDGELDLADASSAGTTPCIAMALEAGTGSKKVLMKGFVRDDTWDWTPGGFVYLSTTAGAFTQTAPSGSGDQVQIVGIATHADRMFFNPDYTTAEIA